MNVISYSLFGFNKERYQDCFDFNSYLRGVTLNLRMARLLYPGWEFRVHIDKPTYEGWKELFDALPIKVVICNEAPLTKAMLWRLLPCFDAEVDYVICRDLDSLLTYREAQAVQYWISRDTKAAHAITDSISHTIPMLGGMIGFKRKHFSERTGFYDWKDMLNGCTIDFNRKGADQDFLNQFIYPKFAQHGSDSITQHYVKGMPNTFLSDYHSEIQDWVEVPGVDRILNESNNVAGHIGAAGYYPPPTYKFLNKYKHKFEDIRAVESKWPDIFGWVKEIEI
jgi:hypothetical protein